MLSKRIARIRLVHWVEDEARRRERQLGRMGYRVIAGPLRGAEELRRLVSDPPDLFIIDLSRLPSQGRDLAVHLRRRRATRGTPLIFAGGEREKVGPVRGLLPDALYASWEGIDQALERAERGGPLAPVVPESGMAGYSGRPLVEKLGIRAEMKVALVGAPGDFEATLGALPEGVRLRRDARGTPDLVIWFPRSVADLRRRIGRLGELAGKGGLWVAWAKKASGVPTDLAQSVVRRAGLECGLVDYKICSIDAVWSGLRFARRKGV